MTDEQTPAAGPLTAESVKALTRWTSHNPRYGGNFKPVADDVWVQVKGNAAEPDGPARRAGDVYWGDQADCDNPVRWYREVLSPASSSSVVQGDASGVELARWIATAETPFAEGGLGNDLYKRGTAYLADYVLSTEGADHEPTEFERALLEDAFAGLMGDEALFGPIRTILAALTPPAEPVSRPAGEGEGEAVAWMDPALEAWLTARGLLPHDSWDWSAIVAMLDHHEQALLSPAAPDAGGGWIDRAPNFGFPTNEPSPRQMVEHYYRSHGMENWQRLADQYCTALQPGGER